MSDRIRTYNPREVTASCGPQIIDGFADDSFITIEPNGDGVTKMVGCHGEVVRSISPDRTCKIKISLLQSAEENAFFARMYDLDQETGEGFFPILIKDLKGNVMFSAETAWVVNKGSLVRGKEAQNREWEIDTGEAVWSE